ncbi:SGNH/GDSL hydrolase family protein [Amycolatopsis xylanica]|uniref:SGNH/GDSL hydrolase family protein n=1 Tax=Amycolatopsis xylanica TaxID=589385 RepID=UPI003183DF8F
MLIVGVLLASSATASGAPEFHNYVALGDGYASGPFIPVQLDNPTGCGRSNANYPSLLAKKLGVASFTDVSCLYADTTYMTRPQSVPFDGTNNPQFDALKPATDLVTLSIGGIDYGLMSSLFTDCPKLRAQDPTGNPCEKKHQNGGVDTALAAIAQIEPRVETVLGGIHERSSGAHVVVVGYPRIFPANRTCPEILPFADGDYVWMRLVMQQLNEALKDAAANGDASFVDIAGQSQGHSVCAPGDAAWVNGKDDRPQDAKAFYPTKNGMAATAEMIAKYLQN